ncbi:MAG: arsenate reductase (glutaredoxin) [Rhodospirillaceae bacterium]|jgi:arsenate reductase (glutaredoxin)|nr:arsenate reductase (glutaredoxin) [Rhodospirillaceae bacterium]MBT5564416.1 arsenate reductase (glutaredoxin) [Rhodospirillaceae bacterium]MBT6089707.1 arsenate reductase (glutaredoxin) [Rhodospirillaceae bacterium]MBT6959938.1 arsenate reductase (glutaredoxin) [Rhodospirillaceae bacterium]MBT7449730.1 arsenate reductase (glutaredoxin) [Rhodospirillaceae bacterium]
MAVTIYHNPRCSKSRQTLALIEEQGIAPEIISYLDTPPNQSTLKDILSMLGAAPGDIIRKKEAKEAGLDIGTMTDAAIIKAMVEHPAIIERPIVVSGKKAAMGRPPESVLEIL